MLHSEISADQLHSLLIDSARVGSQSCNDLIVFYATTTAYEEYNNSAQNENGFIPTTQYFDFKNDVADKNSPLSSTMPSLSEFQEKVRAFGVHTFGEHTFGVHTFGVHNSTHIVVYDDIGNFYASRVWFMFKAMGHERIQVLAGGLNAWLAKGYDTESLRLSRLKPGSFIAKPNLNYQFVQREFIQREFIQQKILEADQQQRLTLPLCDARSPGRFYGTEAEERSWVRSGHIPHSISLHYKRLQNNTGAFLPVNELKQVFTDSSLTVENKNQETQGLAFTCGSGVTACILAQAAEALGYQPLYVYDGSWSDWGADENLPIAKGD